IDDLTREGLGVILEVLLDVEADAYVASFEDRRDVNGRALVARNGVARARSVPMGPVSVVVRAPRVNGRRVGNGERQKVTSTVLVPRRPPAVGGAYKLALDLVCDWATGDFSSVAAHLSARGIAGAASVKAALALLRRRWDEEPIADLRFERVLADVV